MALGRAACYLLAQPLPPLAARSLELRYATQEEAVAVLSLLNHLTQLTGSELSLCTLPGGEAQEAWLEAQDDVDEGHDADEVQLPAMALPQHLSSLALQGTADMPADCSHLTALQSLRLCQQRGYAWDPAQAAEVSSLTRLTELLWLGGGAFPAGLCSLPALERLEIQSAIGLPDAFSQLSRLTCIHVHHMSSTYPNPYMVGGTIPPPMRALTSLEELTVGDGLQQLPPGPYLEGLRVLRVRHAQPQELTRVPPALAAATSLRVLHLPLARQLDARCVQLLAALPRLEHLHPLFAFSNGGRVPAWVTKLRQLRRTLRIHL